MVNQTCLHEHKSRSSQIKRSSTRSKSNPKSREISSTLSSESRSRVKKITSKKIKDNEVNQHKQICDDTDECNSSDDEELNDPVNAVLRDHARKNNKVKFRLDKEKTSEKSTDANSWFMAFLKKKTGIMRDPHDSFKEDKEEVMAALNTTSFLSMSEETELSDTMSKDEIVTPLGKHKHSKKKSVLNFPKNIDDKVKSHLIKGDSFAKVFKYEESTKSYMSAIKNLKKTPSDPAYIYAVRKLSDVQHSILLLRNSSRFLVFGINRENRHQYLKAMKLFTVAYRLRRSVLGDQHASLATILQNLARVQSKRGDNNEALLICALCVNLLKKGHNRDLSSSCLGRCKPMFNPPSFSILLSGIGEICERMGQWEKALAYYQDSLVAYTEKTPKKKLKVLSQPSDNKIDCLLGVQLDRSGKSEHEEMEAFLDTASFYKVDVGKNDLDLAITLHNIGQIHRRLGQYNLAMQAYVAAKIRIESVMGNSHPNVSALLGNIANLYKEMGDNDSAYKIYKKILKFETRTLGLDHPELAITLHNIGTIEYSRKNFTKAIDVFEKVLAIQRNFFGRNHATISVTSSSIGEVYLQMNNTNKAVSAFQESYRVCLKNLGRSHTDVAQLLQKLGSVHYERTGDHSSAKRCVTRALHIYQRNDMNCDHPLVTDAIRLLANIKAAIAVSRIREQ